MRNLKERVAYLHGLTQGLNVNEHSSEGKVLLNIIDVLEVFADEIQTVNLAQMELEEYVESIDEDLSDIEDQIYEEDDEYEDDLYEEALDDDMIEMSCPACHELVTFESDILNEADDIEVTCPYCGDVVYDNVLDADSLQGEKSSSHIIHPGL